MKANELRIGNLLKWNAYGNSGISPVEFINNRNESIYEKVFQLSSGAISYQCEPIPLTEEWLVRLGFTKRNQEKYFMELCYYDERYNLYPNKDGSITFNDDAGHGCTIAIIKHVHQLQNLYFALTGEELTIK